MPNTNPQTTTLEALQDKWERAKYSSHVNYSFFIGATNTNQTLFPQLDIHTIPGIKLFMGASTGNMLVDRREALEMTFRTAAELNLPVMTHCEGFWYYQREYESCQRTIWRRPRYYTSLGNTQC